MDAGVVLREYESRDLDLTRAQAESLQLTGFVNVAPAPAARWRVTATSYVGTLVVDNVKLLIRPKINPENLFLLLEPGLPHSAWRREAYEYDASSDLLPSVIAFFARTLETTLARGVLRSYKTVEETLVALRGRLDVTGQFKRAGVLTPLACTYDDFTEDISENRVLRAATQRALRVPRVDPADRQRLMRQLVALEGVTDKTVRPENVDHIRLTRLNQHYAPALGLARLVLANLTLTDTSGTTSASSFMVDMNDLFQRFVTERLRRELRGRLDVVDEPAVHLGTGRQVTMLPDLLFRKPGGPYCYVGDIKYKLTKDARGRSGDYYQLLAYTTALDLPEGVLIYCRHQDSEIGNSSVTVRNVGTKLVLRSLDLSGPPEQVEREIKVLADDIAIAAKGLRTLSL
ncbi:UNVERIFIED_CONTAM: 5-methylcytosine-specific restriction enzyme subunit McrC [Williamsia faeni]